MASSRPWRGPVVPPNDEVVLYEATRSLLMDVVDAAGGVEQAHLRLHDPMGRVREVSIRFATRLEPAPDGMGLSDPAVEDAWYALDELIHWARTLGDRLRRDAVKKGPYRLSRHRRPQRVDVERAQYHPPWPSSPPRRDPGGHGSSATSALPDDEVHLLTDPNVDASPKHSGSPAVRSQ
jgi:hypothetical protein